MRHVEVPFDRVVERRVDVPVERCAPRPRRESAGPGCAGRSGGGGQRRGLRVCVERGMEAGGGRKGSGAERVGRRGDGPSQRVPRKRSIHRRPGVGMGVRILRRNSLREQNKLQAVL